MSHRNPWWFTFLGDDLPTYLKNAKDYGFTTSDSSGTVNAAALNTALTGGGWVVVTIPGTYYISATIYIPSNTRLTLAPGVIIRQVSGGRFYMLRNTNHTTSSVIADSTVGDHDITIEGGTWWRNDEAAGLPTYMAHTWLLMGIRRLTIRDVRHESDDGGKYSIAGSNIIDFEIRNCTFRVWSAGVQLEGPLENGVIDGTYGYCQDNQVAITQGEYPGAFLTTGSIRNIKIFNTFSDNSRNPVRLVGSPKDEAGVDQGYVMEDIHIKGVHGTVPNTLARCCHVVSLIDDTDVGSDLVGVPMRNILIEDVFCTGVYTGYAQVALSATGIESVTVRNVRVKHTTAATQEFAVALSNWAPNSANAIVTVENVDMECTAGTAICFQLDGSATTGSVPNLRVKNIQMKASSAGSIRMFSIYKHRLLRLDGEDVTLIHSGSGDSYLFRTGEHVIDEVRHARLSNVRVDGVVGGVFYGNADSIGSPRSYVEFRGLTLSNAPGLVAFGDVDMVIYGVTFSAASLPGFQWVVGGSGNGGASITITPQWLRYRVERANMSLGAGTTASTTVPLSVGYLPRGGIVHEVDINNGAVAWDAGATITTVQADAGTLATSNLFGGACNLKTANGMAHVTVADATGKISNTTDTQLAARVTVSGGDTTNELVASGADFNVGFLWSAHISG